MAFIDEEATIAPRPALTGSGSLTISGGFGEMVANFALLGSLIEAAFIVNARAISSTRIRIDFSGILDVNSSLFDVNNWMISTVDLAAVTPTILEVYSPNAFPTTIDLIVSEMTNAATYDVAVANLLPTSGGEPLVSDSYSFEGIGDAPEILSVIASSKNSVRIRFNEPLKAVGGISNPSTYTFDNGLVVTDVTDFENEFVELSTSDQTPGQLYMLTVDGTIQDYANNQLDTPADSPMLGFVEPEKEAPLLTLRMYNFLLQNIRDEDQKGTKFIERLFQGPQAVWEANTQIIYSLTKLWSITEIPSAFLPLLKVIVGWTKDFDNVTERLSPLGLRRLIASSADFWKSRGPEDAVEDILSLTTGARVRIYNYFDFRWILDENIIGEDIWNTSEFAEGEYLYNVRIVDDGTLDREVVRELVRITRPINERVDINYLLFYDRFAIVNDKSQWIDVTGVSVVDDGVLRLPALVDEFSVATSVDSVEWDEYVVSWKVRGETSFDLVFYYTSDEDHYFCRVLMETAGVGFGRFELYKVVATVETLIASANMDVNHWLVDNVYYIIRAEIVREGATNRIRLYLDENLVLATTDDAHASGSAGLKRAGGQGPVDLEEIELFSLPAETDFVDINS